MKSIHVSWTKLLAVALALAGGWILWMRVTNETWFFWGINIGMATLALGVVFAGIGLVVMCVGHAR